jgi:hypothetical protein
MTFDQIIMLSEMADRFLCPELMSSI